MTSWLLSQLAFYSMSPSVSGFSSERCRLPFLASADTWLSWGNLSGAAFRRFHILKSSEPLAGWRRLCCPSPPSPVFLELTYFLQILPPSGLCHWTLLALPPCWGIFAVYYRLDTWLRVFLPNSLRACHHRGDSGVDKVGPPVTSSSQGLGHVTSSDLLPFSTWVTYLQIHKTLSSPLTVSPSTVHVPSNTASFTSSQWLIS